jgi:hypothetical protein
MDKITIGDMVMTYLKALVVDSDGFDDAHMVLLL